MVLVIITMMMIIRKVYNVMEVFVRVERTISVSDSIYKVVHIRDVTTVIVLIVRTKVVWRGKWRVERREP